MMCSISKFFKKIKLKRKLFQLMKDENDKIREMCDIKDWDKTGYWIHRNKSSFKAYRRILKLNKNE